MYFVSDYFLFDNCICQRKQPCFSVSAAIRALSYAMAPTAAIYRQLQHNGSICRRKFSESTILLSKGSWQTIRTYAATNARTSMRCGAGTPLGNHIWRCLTEKNTMFMSLHGCNNVNHYTDISCKCPCFICCWADCSGHHRYRRWFWGLRFPPPTYLFRSGGSFHHRYNLPHRILSLS